MSAAYKFDSLSNGKPTPLPLPLVRRGFDYGLPIGRLFPSNVIFVVMVIAHHLILTGYGHWLPNDPRGSLSTEIKAGKLFPLGDIHFGRKSVQPSRPEVKSFFRKAAPRLEHDILWFSSANRQAISKAFRDVMHVQGYTCYACAIMPNHAHLVIRKHSEKAETMIRHLKTASARALCDQGFADEEHPIWSGDPFKKFLFTPEDVHRTIGYVEANPPNAKLPRQAYEFVTPYVIL